MESDPSIMYDVHPLEVALTDTEIELVKQPSEEVSDWKNKDHQDYLTWLQNVVSLFGKDINTKTVVKRAYKIGLGSQITVSCLMLTHSTTFRQNVYLLLGKVYIKLLIH